jgi:hypothetical protein
MNLRLFNLEKLDFVSTIFFQKRMPEVLGKITHGHLKLQSRRVWKGFQRTSHLRKRLEDAVKSLFGK